MRRCRMGGLRWGGVAASGARPRRRLSTRAKPARAERGEARNAQARASLRRLGEGERPTAVTVAAVVALLLGVTNVVLYAAGVRVHGTTVAGTVGVGAVLLVTAGGMWRAKYWAVLGFQMVLGVTCVFSSLSLLVASSVPGALRSVAVAIAAGVLFWKLIRAMARIQMPERSPRP